MILKSTQILLTCWLLCLTAFFAPMPSVARELPVAVPQPNADATDKQDAIPLTAHGLSNLYRVSNDLYRSAQPKKGGMTSARDLGIKTVISLRETELDRALNRKEATALNTIHVPIVTWFVDERAIVAALRMIHTSPKPVLVHCRHGSDRTGLIVALYRIVFQNWSKEEALHEMLGEQFGHHRIFWNLPRIIRKMDIEKLRSQVFGR